MSSDVFAEAMKRYDDAIAEFEAATAVVIERLKAQQEIPPEDLERERSARAAVLEARSMVLRLQRVLNLADRQPH